MATSGTYSTKYSFWEGDDKWDEIIAELDEQDEQEGKWIFWISSKRILNFNNIVENCTDSRLTKQRMIVV